MGFELFEKLRGREEAACVQDGRDLWPDLAQDLLNTGMHSEIRIDHASQKLESRTMVERRMQNNMMLLTSIEDYSIRFPPLVYTRTTLLQGVGNHSQGYVSIKLLEKTLRSSANIASLPPPALAGTATSAKKLFHRGGPRTVP